MRVVLTKTVADVHVDSEDGSEDDAQFVKTSATHNSSFQNYPHPNDQQGELNYCYTTLPDFCDSLAGSALTPCNTA